MVPNSFCQPLTLCSLSIKITTFVRHFNRPTLTQPSSPRPVPSTCILAKRSIPAQWLAVRWLGHVAIVFVTEWGHLHPKKKKLLKPHLVDLFSPFQEGRFMVYTPISFHKLFEGFDWGLLNESLSSILRNTTAMVMNIQNTPRTWPETYRHVMLSMPIIQLLKWKSWSHEVICLPKIYPQLRINWRWLPKSQWKLNIPSTPTAAICFWYISPGASRQIQGYHPIQVIIICCISISSFHWVFFSRRHLVVCFKRSTTKSQ